jgi:hypothetical protein
MTTFTPAPKGVPRISLRGLRPLGAGMWAGDKTFPETMWVFRSCLSMAFARTCRC